MSRATSDTRVLSRLAKGARLVWVCESGRRLAIPCPGNRWKEAPAPLGWRLISSASREGITKDTVRRLLASKLVRFKLANRRGASDGVLVELELNA